MLSIALLANTPLILLLKQARSFARSTRKATPKHLTSFFVVFLLNTYKVILFALSLRYKLWLISATSYLSLIGPKNLILLLLCPIKVLLYLHKAFLSILF
jgi:hypothetical protein